MTDDFWDAVHAQLTELRSAKNVDDVLRILSYERNPYGPESSGVADGFFAGGDGGAVMSALEDAGWHLHWYKATYHYAIQAPDGSVLTYVEGDLYRASSTGPQAAPATEPITELPTLTISREDAVYWVAIVSWQRQWFEGPFDATTAQDVADWHNSGAGVHSPKSATVVKVP